MQESACVNLPELGSREYAHDPIGDGLAGCPARLFSQTAFRDQRAAVSQFFQYRDLLRKTELALLVAPLRFSFHKSVRNRSLNFNHFTSKLCRLSIKSN